MLGVLLANAIEFFLTSLCTLEDTLVIILHQYEHLYIFRFCYNIMDIFII